MVTFSYQQFISSLMYKNMTTVVFRVFKYWKVLQILLEKNIYDVLSLWILFLSPKAVYLSL